MLKYVPKSCQVHAIAGLAPYQHFVRAIGDAIWDEVDLSRSIMPAVFLFAAASYEPYGDKIGYHSLPFSPGRHSDHMVGIPGFSNSYLIWQQDSRHERPDEREGDLLLFEILVEQGQRCCQIAFNLWQWSLPKILCT